MTCQSVADDWLGKAMDGITYASGVELKVEMVDSTVREEHDGLSHILVDDHEWAWRFALVLWAVAGSLFVAMAIPPIRDVVMEMDDWIYETTYPVKIGVFTAGAWFLNFIGGGLFAWPFRLVIAGILAAKKRWEAFYAWLLALALSEPFIWLLKNALWQGAASRSPG